MWGLRLWLHALPYVLLLAIVGRLIVFGLLAARVNPPISLPGILFHSYETLLGTVAGSIIGVVGGLAVGIVVAFPEGLRRGISGGIPVAIFAAAASGIALGSTAGIARLGGIAGAVAAGLVGGSTVGVALGIAKGSNDGKAVGITSGVTVIVAMGTAGASIGLITGQILGGKLIVALMGSLGGAMAGVAYTFVGAVAGAVAYGIGVGAAAGLATNVELGIVTGAVSLLMALRLYYYPAHFLFLWPRLRPDWYHFHPVAWDENCAVSFPGLHYLLAAYAEQDPQAGDGEIERLIVAYPSQRMAALRARVITLARRSGTVRDLLELDEIVARLPEGARSFLQDIRGIKEGVALICTLQVRLRTMNIPVMREVAARNLCAEIENFRHRIIGFEEPVATSFRAAAAEWAKLASLQLEDARTVVSKQPTPQVFRAGDPVDRAKEAFVARDGVIGELQQQVMLSAGCPGIVLYGRRRTGKSTTLRNLSGFLPPKVIPIIISMQDAEAFTSCELFVSHLSSAILAHTIDVAQGPPTSN
jgi:hypothetical protein